MQRSSWTAILTVVLLAGAESCTSARYHASSVRDATDDADRLTVGVVQREIHRGMSGAEVAQALGSPNVVSTDEKGREVWIYDKIATDHVASRGSGFATVLILGTAAEAGASSTSQRTLTVIIKFDEQRVVRDFAYHSSRF